MNAVLAKFGAGPLALFGLGALSACTGIGGFDGPTEVPSGMRVISGALVAPEDGVLTARDSVGLQLALVAIDTSSIASSGQSGLRAVYTSAVFDPSAELGTPARFAVAVPVGETVAMVLQIPRGNQAGLGRFAALLRFEPKAGAAPTDVLPGAAENIDLGRLSIERGPSSVDAEGATRLGLPRVRLGEGESKNPLTVNDVDGDGLPDYEDPDSDGDFIPDELDPDADGDGVLDVFQSLVALPDSDGSGVPDVMRR